MIALLDFKRWAHHFARAVWGIPNYWIWKGEEHTRVKHIYVDTAGIWQFWGLGQERDSREIVPGSAAGVMVMQFN
jgi:hypothetical protein